MRYDNLLGKNQIVANRERFENSNYAAMIDGHSKRVIRDALGLVTRYDRSPRPAYS